MERGETSLLVVVNLRLLAADFHWGARSEHEKSASTIVRNVAVDEGRLRSERHGLRRIAERKRYENQ
jgi:hypothetical protein